jgi:hypothetical protein
LHWSIACRTIPAVPPNRVAEAVRTVPFGAPRNAGGRMTQYTLAEAAKAAGKSKSTVLRSIRAGRISAVRDELTGGWLVEPAELHRLYAKPRDVVHGAAKDTPRNGHDAAETAELRARLDDAHETIRDLRARLDAEAEERRKVQAQLTALLTDQRPPPAPEPPRSLWGTFLAWRRGR